MPTPTSDSGLVAQIESVTPPAASTAVTPVIAAAYAFAGSVSGGSTPYQYFWNFGDGDTGSGTLTPTHTYHGSGSFTALLTATDAKGNTTSSTIVVKVPGVALGVSVFGPSSGNMGAPLTFAASPLNASYVDWSAGFNYQWNFGDGTTGTGQAPSHTFNTAGTYTVSVTATNQAGTSSATGSTQVVVLAPNVITIDQSWLQQNGPAPYLLTQAGATYRLETNVNAPNTAFVATTKNITLDLNGYTVSYDTQPPVTVTNGGFEQGSSPTDVPGWDISKAPGAQRVAAPNGMWGDWALELPNITATETITSAPITIPAANVQYAALITPKSFSSATDPAITLAVVDTVTQATLASSQSPSASEGFSPVTEFTPTSTHPVELVITVVPPAGKTSDIYLDYAAIEHTGSYGVVATPSPWFLPPQLQIPAINQGAHSVSNFTVENGTVTQGGGGSYAASAVFAKSVIGITINGVAATASGDDTDILELYYATDPVVMNCILEGKILRISDRKTLYSAIKLSAAQGPVIVRGNAITGTLDTGVLMERADVKSAPILISDNSIEQDTLVADGYGIVMANVGNFVIANNTVKPVNGRGLMLDTFSGTHSQYGRVDHNTLAASEHPNLEYDDVYGQEVVGMEVRVFQAGVVRDVSFTDNTFSAETGPGNNWAAAGVRVYIDGTNTLMGNSGLVFRNNTFQAVLNPVDPDLLQGSQPYSAWALTLSSVPVGTGLEFLDNTFASNHMSINLGDDYGYRDPISGVRFIGNTLTKLAQGAAVTYRSVNVGNWRATTNDDWLIDSSYAGGATDNSVFTLELVKDVETGCLVNLVITGAGGSPAAGATVSLVNATQQQVFSGVTGSDGKITGIPVITTEYQQTTSDPTKITTTELNPYFLTVTYQGKTTTFSISPTGDQTIPVKLN